jgi:FAD binding domain
MRSQSLWRAVWHDFTKLSDLAGKITHEETSENLFSKRKTTMTVVTQTSNKISDSTSRPTVGSTSLSPAAVSALRKRIRGAVLTAADEGYDAARQVWNAMIDRKPGVIARCTDASDVQTVVDFARDVNALLSVRGGGHNIAGSAVNDGGW